MIDFIAKFPGKGEESNRGSAGLATKVVVGGNILNQNGAGILFHDVDRVVVE